MKANSNKSNLSAGEVRREDDANSQGYPLYAESEDIYNKSQKEGDINPEDISKIKDLNEKDDIGKNNEDDFSENFSGSDLDVPGSELDDIQEDIGSEDEENNYYSIGGDDHDDLDEDKGE
jgi:hypothetical protein